VEFFLQFVCEPRLQLCGKEIQLPESRETLEESRIANAVGVYD
jgi:hypothetical protein